MCKSFNSTVYYDKDQRVNVMVWKVFVNYLIGWPFFNTRKTIMLLVYSLLLTRYYYYQNAPNGFASAVWWQNTLWFQLYIKLMDHPLYNLIYLSFVRHINIKATKENGLIIFGNLTDKICCWLEGWIWYVSQGMKLKNVHI